MNKISGVPIPTDKLVYRLRLMADSGGMLTRDRTRSVIEAADRLEEFDNQVNYLSGQVYELNRLIGQLKDGDGT